MKTIITIGIFVVAILIAVVLEFSRRKRLQKYWLRSCTGTEWRQRFPDSPKEEIRAFLSSLVDAFAFSRNKRLKFDPDDKVMDIYRTVYPPSSAVDSMELESFALTLERKYGIDFATLNNPDVTLGQLFEMTRNPNKQIQAIAAKRGSA